MSWSILYMFFSLDKELPWTHCLNQTKGNGEDLIDIDKGGEGENVVTLSLAVVLGLVCIVQLLMLMLGRAWMSGPVSKTVALVTLTYLLVLMVFGLQEEGSGWGLSRVFRVDGTHLISPDIWLDALGQAMWTLGPTFGLLISRASYRKFREKIRIDAYIASAVNIGVALLVCLAIFPFYGRLYPCDAIDICDPSDAIDMSPGFFFIISSYSMTKLPVPQLGGAILYLCLGIGLMDHTHALASTVVISLTDLLPVKWRSGGRNFICQFTLCLLGFVCALPFIMSEGLVLLTSVDTYVPWVSAVVLGYLEMVGFVYVYGVDKISNHFNAMSRKHIIILPFLWKYILPLVLLVSEKEYIFYLIPSIFFVFCWMFTLEGERTFHLWPAGGVRFSSECTWYSLLLANGLSCW
ncbi:hypothetical protein SK128_014959 [Halocaridina rubra]|uniref:Sodium-dependent nutrient amino acid transporter 1 n=1 Tax=Halocaridina rubra TaxID=373956 RepID=A0AAN8XIX4_HALRR